VETQQTTTVSKYEDSIRTINHGWYYTAPLFAAYIIGLYFINSEATNWEMNGIMAVIFEAMLWVGLPGSQLIPIFTVLTLVSMTIAMNSEKTRFTIVSPNIYYFLRMLNMALFLSLILNSVANLFITGILYIPFSQGFAQLPTIQDFFLKFTTAAGAGFLEELLCRVIILGFLSKAINFVIPNTPGKVIAVIITALFFSGFHYIHGFGFDGDTFDIRTFIYRAILGVAYGFVYLKRGFASAAWTHAFTTLWVSANII